MNKQQWAAVYNFCNENGYTLTSLVTELKRLGVVSNSCKVIDLNYYVDGETYDDMYKFLTEGVTV